MAEELQGLLKRIHEEGLSKAEQEKKDIIAVAEGEAEKILAEAKTKAEAMIKAAKEETDNYTAKGKAALEQASRDILVQLKNEMIKRIEKIVKTTLKDAMNPEFMKEIISTMAEKYLQTDPKAELSLHVLVAAKDLEKLENLLKGSLSASFKSDPKIFSRHDIDSGLKVSFDGADAFFDFSDDAFAELICAYAGPRFAEYFTNQS